MVTSNNRKNASFWIKRLQLSQHPEGGFYRETHRADIEIDFCKESDNKQQIASENVGRSISSTIYYLLDGSQVSVFHRMKNADEIWHFYKGSSLTLYIIKEATRKVLEFRLGDKPEKGESFQVFVKRGSWFGAKVNDLSSYSLVGCTVSPAFSFADFEIASRSKLTSMCPEHEDIIRMLT
jgi:predicted cupin superfamily sugar epimerase